MNQPLRLLVVDDHALFRRGLVSLLGSMPEVEVVGEANDGQEALDLIQKVHPDILLLDLNMPKMDGVATLQALRRLERAPLVLMLTISQNETDLLSAIKAGADGYLLKNTEPEDLHRSILRLARGQGILSPEVTAPLLKVLAQGDQSEAQILLSEREVDVLRCLADGLTTQLIAKQLYISENTVKTHVRHILAKLEASNRAEAVSKAIQMRILRSEERG